MRWLRVDQDAVESLVVPANSVAFTRSGITISSLGGVTPDIVYWEFIPVPSLWDGTAFDPIVVRVVLEDDVLNVKEAESFVPQGNPPALVSGDWELPGSTFSSNLVSCTCVIEGWNTNGAQQTLQFRFRVWKGWYAWSETGGGYPSE